MRVIYKQNILEQLRLAIVEAGRQGKKIHKFVVTTNEAEELKAELCNGHPFLTVTTVYGIPIEVEKG